MTNSSSSNFVKTAKEDASDADVKWKRNIFDSRVQATIHVRKAKMSLLNLNQNVPCTAIHSTYNSDFVMPIFCPRLCITHLMSENSITEVIVAMILVLQKIRSLTRHTSCFARKPSNLSLTDTSVNFNVSLHKLENVW